MVGAWWASLSERPRRGLQPAGGALQLPGGGRTRLLPRLGQQWWRARPRTRSADAEPRAVLCVVSWSMCGSWHSLYDPVLGAQARRVKSESFGDTESTI